MSRDQDIASAKYSLAIRPVGSEISYKIQEMEDFSVKIVKITFKKKSDTSIEIIP